MLVRNGNTKAEKIRFLENQLRDAENWAAECESNVEDAKYWIGCVKDDIAEYQELADAKYEEYRDAKNNRDWAYADVLYGEVQEQNMAVRDKRDDLESCYEDLNEAKQNYKQALYERNNIQIELEIAAGRGHWRQKSCKRCGAPVRYRDDWENIPNYCKECKAEFRNRTSW